jgi:hypothetical protein
MGSGNRYNLLPGASLACLRVVSKRFHQFRGFSSILVRDQDAGGSNPLAPANPSYSN